MSNEYKYSELEATQLRDLPLAQGGTVALKMLAHKAEATRRDMEKHPILHHEDARKTVTYKLGMIEGLECLTKEIEKLKGQPHAS